jgi:O-antigen/teichoic acid export membrane protein
MSQLAMALERRGIWQLAGVFRNAVQLGGAKLMARLLTVFWTVMLARTLGVGDFGEYTYLTALVILLAMFSDGGISTIVGRDAAAEPKKAGRELPTALTIIVLLNVGAAALVIGIALANELSWHRFWLTALIALYLPANAVFNVFCAVFRARGFFGYDSLLNVGDSVSFIVLSGAALALGWGVEGVIAAFAARQYLLLVACVAIFGQTGYSSRFGWDRSAARYLGKEGWPMILSGAANHAYARVDIIVLYSLAGAEAAGTYSVAARLIDGAMLGLGALGFASLPVLSRLAADDPRAAGKMTVRIALLAGAGTLVLSAVGGMLSQLVINIMYGADFADAGPVLAILLVTIPAYTLSQVFGSLLVALGRQHLLVLTYGIALITSISMNVWLVPHYSFIGSAISAVATSGLLLVLLVGMTRLATRAPRPTARPADVNVGLAAEPTAETLG